VSSLADWLRGASARLAAISDTPRLDAELIAAQALGLERTEMILAQPRLITPPNADVLLARALMHEPIAHITGSRDFWTLTLKVTPDVLVPRPDSETLIEVAVQHFKGAAGPARILDLGTGSGALLLAALDEWRSATGLGIDLSPAALAVAQDNAKACAMAERAAFRLGDWAEGLDERFDLILCNPPYIQTDALLPAQVRGHEPALALFGGADGLACYRLLAVQMGRLISPGGIACIEIGFDQGESAAALFRAAGHAVALHHDLAGNARCLALSAV
jgi:release factor glutamine methyltransferase